ncbi:MAG TPA: hypothetical protein VIN37_09125 [Candidatus Limnocylindria bacterium]|jgi:hypothetical protein
MGARQDMTDRALVERNDQPSEELSPSGIDYGEGAEDWRALAAALPCCVYTKAASEQLGSTGAIFIEDVRMLVPSGTDVTVLDRVGPITDRLGVVKRAGPYRITAVVARKDHLELGLRLVTE